MGGKQPEVESLQKHEGKSILPTPFFIWTLSFWCFCEFSMYFLSPPPFGKLLCHHLILCFIFMSLSFTVEMFPASLVVCYFWMGSITMKKHQSIISIFPN